MQPATGDETTFQIRVFFKQIRFFNDITHASQVTVGHHTVGWFYPALSGRGLSLILLRGCIPADKFDPIIPLGGLSVDRFSRTISIKQRWIL